jgi:hypothetical protein
VTELVEAIAAVVSRNPRLGVTVGVEGDGDPMVLRFFYEDGQVQVTAENNLAPQPHADFDVEVGEPVDEFPPAPPMSPDDQDRFGPQYGYEHPGAYSRPAHYAAHDMADHDMADHDTGEHDTAERRYGGFAPETGESSRDLGARMRDLGMASSREPGRSREPETEFPPHPLAPTPPPTIPPQTIPAQTIPTQTYPTQTTRRIDPEQYRAPVEPTATQRAGATERLVPPPPAEPRGMPTPLPEPIPLKVERPEETEMAARRLAALLRDDPTLLSQRPD